MIAQAEKLLAKVRARLDGVENELLEGKAMGDGTVEGRHIAYRAGVSFRRECFRLIEDIEECFGDAPAQNDESEMGDD